MLRRGDSGFYLFMTIEHKPDMPAVQAAQYAWMGHEWFPVERSRVTGRLRFTDARPAANVHVLLSPTDVPWWQEWKGYHFWAKTDEEGQFAIGHVRKGAYTLVAAGADQFEGLRRAEPVVVRAGESVSLA